MKKIIIGLFTMLLISCQSREEAPLLSSKDSPLDLKIVGAMKNVMWKGELGSSIALDTLSNKKGLYGLGPMSFLRGEVLIYNGVCYTSQVGPDSTMIVTQNEDVSAPFFVYGNVLEWTTHKIPSNIKTRKDFEVFIEEKTKSAQKPFAFLLLGTAKKATIHIQNLPLGTEVSSPKQAHQGQVNYTLTNKPVEILGFYSTQHQGIFTHHDSFVHMHLISSDKSQMGHLDELELGEMELLLPKK